MKIGFLGYGHLARAIDSGIAAKSLISAENIFICAKSEETKEYAKSRGHLTCADAKELISVCDIIILAIKPKVFREMSGELKTIEVTGKRVISVMAAVSENEIASVFSCPVMRVMPTIAVTEACDIMGYYTKGGFDDVVSALNLLGDAVSLDEESLDRLTVASSCGLGFAAHIMQIYKDECMRYGFTDDASSLIVKRIFSYAAECGNFEALEKLVATKGGATEAGISAMNDNQKKAISEAFDASAERAVPKK